MSCGRDGAVEAGGAARRRVRVVQEVVVEAVIRFSVVVQAHGVEEAQVWKKDGG